MQSLDTAWLKAHWYYVAASVLGVIVLYELLHNMGAAPTSSGAAPVDLSGGASQLAGLSAQADLVSAQYNAQVSTAQIQGNVADMQAATALQLGLADTAAKLDAQNRVTDASVAIATLNTEAGVTINGQNVTGATEINKQNVAGAEQIQSTVTAGQVKQTQIEGDTLQGLAKTAVSVPLAQIAAVNSQIQNIQTYSKHASQDYGAIAPVLAEETGQGATVGAAKPTKSTTAQNISAVSGGISTVLSGLFGSGGA